MSVLPPNPLPLAEPQSRLRTWRDAIRELSPVWLRSQIGSSILYAAASILDGLDDALSTGLKARYPGLVMTESLKHIGAERRIRRGRYEGDEQYAERLIRWLDDHRRRGGPYAMLEQLHAHYYPNNFAIELRYASGRNYQMSLAGDIMRGDVTWTPPDGPPERWARWWLFYQWPTPIDDDGVWGDPGTWGDGGVWGSNLSPEEVRDIRLIPREWNAQHAIGRIVLNSPLKSVSISTEGA